MQKNITIAISCFNTSKTVSELLRRVKEVAVRNPSHQFELVLVDDGSADNSFEVACAGLEQMGLPSIAIRFSRNFREIFVKWHRQLFSMSIFFTEKPSPVM